MLYKATCVLAVTRRLVYREADNEGEVWKGTGEFTQQLLPVWEGAATATSGWVGQT